MQYPDSVALQSPPETPKGCFPVLTGVDTLELTHHKMLCAEAIESILAAKCDAKSAGRAQVVALNGIDFEVMSYGGKNGFDLTLKNPDLMIVARSRRAKIETMPSVMISMRSAWLNDSDWTLAYLAFIDWVSPLLGEGKDEEWQVSRIDLFADFQGWVPKINELFLGERRCWSGAGRMKAFPVFEGARMQTIRIGEPNQSEASAKKRTRRKRSKRASREAGEMAFQGERIGKDKLVMRIYDKDAEIRQSSGKIWFRDLWSECEHYDPEQSVWRIEFQCRREALKSFRHVGAPNGVRTVPELAQCFGSLWRYLTGEKIGKRAGFISLRRPTYAKTGTKRLLARIDQWSLHSAWQAIRDFQLEDEPIRRTATRNLRSAEALVPGASGYNASMLAEFSLAQGGDLDQLLRNVIRVSGARKRYGLKIGQIMSALWSNHLQADIEDESLDVLIDALVMMWRKAESLRSEADPRFRRFLARAHKAKALREPKLHQASMPEFQRDWEDLREIREAFATWVIHSYARRWHGRFLTHRMWQSQGREGFYAPKSIMRAVIEKVSQGLLRAGLLSLEAAELEWVSHCHAIADKARARSQRRIGMKKLVNLGEEE